ncbi:alkyl hydroperoxide reductase subunit C [Sneathiella limimaris]|uniref:alkyl hydroperoxide reductase subunit C n=1 Tax=Sneathiella limimaris TaxID=1964213 RepID=UPI00146F4F87|nr:alkyl hydroperoxide reductase subunit C [Sneathiella limimaris]
MAIINKSIPEFTTDAFHDGELKTVTSDDVKGKWSIFVFYPADFTFVCPTELEDMAKHYDELKALGVEVYSVSTDTHFAHAAWHASSDAIGKIKFPMLGDPTGKISRGFDVMIEEDGLALRGTFLADPDGIIKVAEIHDLGIGRSAKDMVRKVKAAQYVAANDGEVCPAAWEEGQETLTPSLDLVGKI